MKFRQSNFDPEHVTFQRVMWFWPLTFASRSRLLVMRMGWGHQTISYYHVGIFPWRLLLLLSSFPLIQPAAKANRADRASAPRDVVGLYACFNFSTRLTGRGRSSLGQTEWHNGCLSQMMHHSHSINSCDSNEWHWDLFVTNDTNTHKNTDRIHYKNT